MCAASRLYYIYTDWAIYFPSTNCLIYFSCQIVQFFTTCCTCASWNMGYFLSSYKMFVSTIYLVQPGLHNALWINCGLYIESLFNNWSYAHIVPVICPYHDLSDHDDCQIYPELSTPRSLSQYINPFDRPLQKWNIFLGFFTI